MSFFHDKAKQDSESTGDLHFSIDHPIWKRTTSETPSSPQFFSLRPTQGWGSRSRVRPLRATTSSEPPTRHAKASDILLSAFGRAFETQYESHKSCPSGSSDTNDSDDLSEQRRETRHSLQDPPIGAVHGESTFANRTGMHVLSENPIPMAPPLSSLPPLTDPSLSGASSIGEEPEEPQIVYLPIVPPSRKHEFILERRMYEADAFKPPIFTSSSSPSSSISVPLDVTLYTPSDRITPSADPILSASDFREDGSCIICWAFVQSYGMHTQTIVEMFNDNCDRMEPRALRGMLTDFWNTNIAGIPIKVDKLDLFTSVAKTRNAFLNGKGSSKSLNRRCFKRQRCDTSQTESETDLCKSPASKRPKKSLDTSSNAKTLFDYFPRNSDERKLKPVDTSSPKNKTMPTHRKTHPFVKIPSELNDLEADEIFLFSEPPLDGRPDIETSPFAKSSQKRSTSGIQEDDLSSSSSDIDPETPSESAQSRCVLPFVNESMIYYHFKYCYKEKNGSQIIFDQIRMLTEIQQAVYDNGVFCVPSIDPKFLEREHDPRKEKPPFLASLPPPQDKILTSAIQLSETASALVDAQIVEYTKELDVLTTKLTKLEKCYEDELKTENASTRYLEHVHNEIQQEKRNIKAKENQIKHLLEKYSSLVDSETILKNGIHGKTPPTTCSPNPRNVSLPQTSAAPNGNTSFVPVGPMCINIKEAALVKEFSRTILSLLEKASRYQPKKSIVPPGWSHHDFYAVLPFLSELTQSITQNKKKPSTGRSVHSSSFSQRAVEDAYSNLASTSFDHDMELVQAGKHIRQPSTRSSTPVHFAKTRPVSTTDPKQPFKVTVPPQKKLGTFNPKLLNKKD